MSDAKVIFLAAVDALQDGNFDYVIYGGLAAGIWGEPRFTDDVDLVLFLPERHAYKFLRAAAAHGFAVEEDLAIQQIQISGWARLPLGSKDSLAHLDFALGDTAFDQSVLQRRKEVTLFEKKTWVPSPEDVLLYKLVAGRDQDLPDAKRIIQRQKGLDHSYLRHWADWWSEQGVPQVREQLERLLSKADSSRS